MSRSAPYGHVAVLLGGTSPERAISLKSGRTAADALRALGHRVSEIDAGANLAAELTVCAPDAVFIALHGRHGEDGTVQGLLELMGLPYTGSGVLASAAACDKLHAKRLFAQAGIASPQTVPVGTGLMDSGDAGDEILPFPLVVKPNHGGSSIGICRVQTGAELADAVNTARADGDEALIEQCIDGREITVAVLDGSALPVVEIVAPERFFSYDAKYTDTGTRYITPAELPDTTTQAAQALAQAAYTALGCAGAARVDLMLEGDTLRPYVLEVNTIPGMTPKSLLPMAAQAAGMSFNDLIAQMLLLAQPREYQA